jgi:hypothetical protein
MMRTFTVVSALLCQLIGPAVAEEPLRSECLAMANAPPRATPVSLRRVAAKADEVAITYAGHSTYYIDTPGGGSRPITTAPTGPAACPTSSP